MSPAISAHMNVDVIFFAKAIPKGKAQKGWDNQTVTTEVCAYDVGELMHTLTTFQGGKLKEFVPMWRDIASHPNTLQYVSGVQILCVELIVLRQETPRLSVFKAQRHHFQRVMDLFPIILN